jgi:hypothetical protein
MISVVVVLRRRPQAIGKGFQQLRNRMDFWNKTKGQFGQRGNFHSVGGHDDLDGVLDTIKLKLKTISRHI